MVEPPGSCYRCAGGRWGGERGGDVVGEWPVISYNYHLDTGLDIWPAGWCGEQASVFLSVPRVPRVNQPEQDKQTPLILSATSSQSKIRKLFIIYFTQWTPPLQSAPVKIFTEIFYIFKEKSSHQSIKLQHLNLTVQLQPPPLLMSESGMTSFPSVFISSSFLNWNS